MLESLERRRLLSASLVAGTLTVEGTAGNDEIVLRREGTVLHARVNTTVTDFTYASVTNIKVFGLAGNDLVRFEEIAKPATLDGGAGNDRLIGGAGSETFFGGDGSDIMDGRLGADTFNGGGGIDTVSYEGRPARVVVTIDNVANDGAAATLDRPAENDNVKSDVENLIGGNASDSLSGSALNNRIDGRGGNDVVNGLGGNDILLGGDGNDQLNGGDGNDGLNGGRGADVFNGGVGVDTANYEERTGGIVVTLDNVANDGFQGTLAEPGERDNVKTDVENVIGGNGSDRIVGSAAANRLDGRGGNDQSYGGGGNDVLIGGPGSDRLFGGDGDDTLIARDGIKDFLDGGGGTDKAAYDAVDERVSIEGVVT